jgi:predicted HD phosphohydrolase
LREERRRLLYSTIQQIEKQMAQYAEEFVRNEYGPTAVKALDDIEIIAIDAYDEGGVSEATEEHIKIAAKRDVDAGILTSTTKLIIRHELGHILDDSSEYFFDFEEEIKREKTAWVKAKPRNAAENWYKNLSIRTHLDPLKMQSLGFPRPESKLSEDQLKKGIASEVERMKKYNPWVDEVLAKRYAMANLIENPNYYSQTTRSS